VYEIQPSKVYWLRQTTEALCGQDSRTTRPRLLHCGALLHGVLPSHYWQDSNGKRCTRMRDKRKPWDCRYYQIRRWSTGKTCGTYTWCPVKRARIERIACPCDAWNHQRSVILDRICERCHASLGPCLRISGVWLCVNCQQPKSASIPPP
jgi:hypothetical protein